MNVKLTRAGNVTARIVPAALCFLTACSTPDNGEQVTHPTPKPAEAQASPAVLETYPGGVILKVDRTKPLPNVFGKPDIFGRKVYAGYTEIRYQGMTEDGRILLRLTEG